MTVIDTRRLAGQTELDTDLCIVGAGAAGICLAAELAGSGIRVALLEAGGRRYTRNDQALYAGYNVGLPADPLTLSRFRMLGGSTTRWAGQCGTLNPDDFSKRDWIPNSGWPFGLETLDPYYRAAGDLLGFDDGEDAWAPTSDRPTLDFPGFPLESKMFRFCKVTDFRTLHGLNVADADNVTTYLHANVVAIEANPGGSRIDRAMISTLDGQRLSVKAKTFVLAAGGIENVRLMLVSAASGCGIINPAGNVGRYFMDHPFFYSGVVTFAGSGGDANAHVLDGYDSLEQMCWRLATIQFDEAWLRKKKLVNCAVHFLRRPGYKTTAAYTSQAGTSLNTLTQSLRSAIWRGPDWGRYAGSILRGTDKVLKSRFDQLRHLFSPEAVLAMRVTLENVPDSASRIYLSTRKDRLGVPLATVDWRVGDLERRSLARFHEILAAAMKQTGRGDVELRIGNAENGWPESMGSGKHHMGGTRMHVDPRQGVVDPDCKVHGIGNLYVAGSSVFPSGGYANPTFTILALTLRLAEHLRRTMASRLHSVTP